MSDSLTVFAVGLATVASLFGINVTSVDAGRLNGVRKNASSSKSRDDKSKDDDDEKRRKKEEKQRSISRGGKLAAVRTQTHKTAKKTKHHAPRASHSGHARRHSGGHSHGSPGIGLYLHRAYIPPAPIVHTIIEEHHYHEPPIAVPYSSPLPPPPTPGPTGVAEPVGISGSYYEPVPMPSPSDCPLPVSSHAHVVVAEPIAFHEPWSVRFGVEYGSDTEALSQFGFDLVVNRSAGLGIDTSVKLFREEYFGERDHLWLGDVNIIYELFPTEYVRPRAGIGLNWLADDYGGEAGLNLTVGADVRLTSKLTMSGEVDFGTLGDADLFHGRASLGIQATEHLEWFVGYDYFDIGGATLDGVMGGLRFRF